MSDDLSKDMLVRLNRLEMFAGHVADWAGNPLLHIKARAMLEATAHDVAEPKGLISSETLPSDDIAKRMEAFVRRAAADLDHEQGPVECALQIEARAIVAMFPDKDRDHARSIAEEFYSCIEQHIEPLTAAIRRGRALERDSREG